MCHADTATMNVMLVPIFLLLEVIVPATTEVNLMKVTSYNTRKSQNGEEMCALDTANETTSSSSLQDCSLSCANDAICTGFNIKNTDTCDVYNNYQPKITTLLSACTFYKVIITVMRRQLLDRSSLVHFTIVLNPKQPCSQNIWAAFNK